MHTLHHNTSHRIAWQYITYVYTYIHASHYIRYVTSITHIHTYMHACMHCIHTYITYITYIHTLHAYMHACIHYIHACIHYIHVHITYIHWIINITYAYAQLKQKSRIPIFRELKSRDAQQLLFYSQPEAAPELQAFITCSTRTWHSPSSLERPTGSHAKGPRPNACLVTSAVVDIAA